MICLPFEQPEVAILTKRSYWSRIVWLITQIDNQAFVNTEPKSGRLISGTVVYEWLGRNPDQPGRVYERNHSTEHKANQLVL